MIPPCKADGTDCPQRRAGCQADCEKYKAFRKEQDKLNAELRPGKEAMFVLLNSARARSARQYRNSFKK